MTRVHLDRLVVRLKGSAAEAHGLAASLPEAIGRALLSSGALSGLSGRHGVGATDVARVPKSEAAAPAAAGAIARAARRRP